MIEDTIASAAPIQRTPPPKNPAEIVQSTDYYLMVGFLIGVIFLGAIVIWAVDRWRKGLEREENPSLTLTDYREMYESGEITEKEYDRIRAKMAAKIKGLPTTPPQVPPASSPPSSPKSE
ncbi:hypothetical protein BH11PLA2_BH11PLA2_37310 [soil metagenome]